MKYKGKLYGKIGKKHFDTGKTSDDFDELGKELGGLKDAIVDFMKDLDRNCVEIPAIMHDDFNELERLTDK